MWVVSDWPTEFDDLPALGLVGEQIERAARRDERRSRGWLSGLSQRARVGAVIVAVAAVVLLVVVFAGSPATEPVDAIARARAALAVGHQIVHMRITSSFAGPGSRRGPRQPPVEVWATNAPDRWRTVTPVAMPFGPGPPTGPTFGQDGYPIYGLVQYAYANGRTRTLNPARDTITVFPYSKYAAKNPAPDTPLRSLGGGGVDPASQLRDALTNGNVVDEGEQNVGGRTVRRLVSTKERTVVEHGHHGLTFRVRQRTRLTYDVDPKTFTPVDGEASYGPVDHFPKYTERFRITTYERIPLTTQTAALLKIPVDPKTRIYYQPSHLGHRPPKPHFKCFPRAAFLKCRANGTLK